MICRQCRFWSDQHAELTLNGTRASCLHEHSHHSGTMMLAHHGCMWGEDGEAIDTPDMTRAALAAAPKSPDAG
jgi:hypothetical protein